VDILNRRRFKSRLAKLLIGVALVPAGATVRAQGLPDTAFVAVSYVETRAAAAAAGASALARYRAASRAEDGFIAAQSFEQVGRPGHFAIVEAWRDEQAFAARDAAAQQALTAALEPIRVSNYDQRPYKPIAAAAAADTSGPEVVFVITHVDVAPNPEVPALLGRLAEASRRDAGNLRFDVVQHTMRSNHFTVIEAWRDQQALDAHVAAAHTRAYRDELQPHTGSPLDERVYKALD